MLILKVVKVLCFDTLLQVLILKVVSREAHGPFSVWKKTREPALWQGDKITGANLEEVSGIQAHYFTELIYKTAAVLSIEI